MARTTGVLPSQMLKELMGAGFIKDIGDEFVNPASIDLPLSDEAYRLESIFLPKPGEKVRSVIERTRGIRHDLRSPLEVGVAYAIRIRGTHELPPNIYGYVNPKSSTGRINLLCRVVADGVDMYDALRPEGWKGEIWVLARASSFPVLVSEGYAVSQLRLFDGKTFLDDLEMNIALKKDGLLFGVDKNPLANGEIRKHTDSLLLSLKVSEGVTGWECRGTSKVLDFSKIRHYRPKDFFSPIEVRDGSFRAHAGSFYILTTLERIAVPPGLSAELRPIDPRFGEFRSHAAGYIDPGWGWGIDGSVCGRPITLEMTPFETADFSNGQTFARIRYEHMKATPEIPYDGAKSNYTSQNAATLSKHFKTD